MNPSKKKNILIITIVAIAIVISAAVVGVFAWSNSKENVEIKFNEAIEEKDYGKALKYTNVEPNAYINAEEFKSFYENNKNKITLVPVYEGEKVFFVFEKYAIDLKDYTQDLSIVLPSESTLKFNGVNIKPYKSNEFESTDTFYVGRVLTKDYKVKITNPLINDSEQTLTIDNKSKLTSMDDIKLSLKKNFSEELEDSVKNAIRTFYLCASKFNNTFENVGLAQNYSTEEENVLNNNFDELQGSFFFHGAGTHYTTSDFKITSIEPSYATLLSQDKCRFYAALDYTSSEHYRNVHGEGSDSLNQYTHVNLNVEMIRVKDNWEVYSITEVK